MNNFSFFDGKCILPFFIFLQQKDEVISFPDLIKMRYPHQIPGGDKPRQLVYKVNKLNSILGNYLAT